MVICGIGSTLMIIGLTIMGIGWRYIYRSKEELVDYGIYRYIRHPQYLGLILVTLGMLIQWPTVLNLIMWPILLVAYVRLAKKEEKELEGRFGDRFVLYSRNSGFFLPKFRRVGD